MFANLWTVDIISSRNLCLSPCTYLVIPTLVYGVAVKEMVISIESTRSKFSFEQLFMERRSFVAAYQRRGSRSYFKFSGGKKADNSLTTDFKLKKTNFLRNFLRNFL